MSPFDDSKESALPEFTTQIDYKTNLLTKISGLRTQKVTEREKNQATPKLKSAGPKSLEQTIRISELFKKKSNPQKKEWKDEIDEISKQDKLQTHISNFRTKR